MILEWWKDGIEGTLERGGPRVVTFACPRGCGTTEWWEHSAPGSYDAGPCARAVRLARLEEMVDGHAAGSLVAVLGDWLPAPPVPACHRCGAVLEGWQDVRAAVTR